MVKAETCDNCHGYVKVLYQIEDPDLEPLADAWRASASTCWCARAAIAGDHSTHS